MFAPWLDISFQLFMVTYLQYHSDDGKLNSTWKSWTFQKVAFETVGRSDGKRIDRISNHVMASHVIHHLYFEQVLHYQQAVQYTEIVHVPERHI
jgi:omega-3 fatty acid desaturase (delta-15 desaturase)